LKKSITCAFTGYRSLLLPWKHDETNEKCLALKKQIREQIIKAVDDGYYYFICGMSLGCDIYFAELVLELKKTNSLIELIPTIPYEYQYASWNKKNRERYFDILSGCSLKKVISPIYTGTCLMDKNKYMVDKSSRLIAVYNGDGKSSSRKTIKYAEKTGVDIVIIKYLK